MINGKKVGVGIVTHNRPDGLMKLYHSLPQNIVDSIVIVNDGHHYPIFDEIKDRVITNEKNLGVGKSKNIALRYLLAQNVDHFFLIEDDVFVKNHTVFERYITASKITGIQHFMYSQATPACADEIVKPKLNVEFGKIRIQLYHACDGAFVYYSKRCLDAVGLMDEEYYNAMEHVDHTLAIIKAGLHPPCWYFADIDNSKDFIGFDHKDPEHSTIFTKPGYKDHQRAAMEYFKKKHGIRFNFIPDVGTGEVLRIIKLIKQRNAMPAFFQQRFSRK